MDIGIIGGADGPTTIFVTPGINWYDIAIIAIVCIIAVRIINLLIRNKKSKD